MTQPATLDTVLRELRACRLCRDAPLYLPPLPHQPRPVIQASATARLCIAGQAPGTRAVALPDNSYNQSTYFLSVFGRPDSSSACECERTQEASLAQSLHLLNAAEIQTQLSRGNGRADTLTKDTRPDDDKISDLYHIALSRDPNAAEVKFAHTHLNKKTAGKAGDEAFKGKKEAYEDILWALLNTKEFLFNH